MLPFYIQPNLVSDEGLSEGYPWEFKPSETELAAMRALPKATRRALMLKKSTEWNIYTGIEAVNPSLRITRTNPPRALNYLVIDFDTRVPLAQILEFIKPLKYKPNKIEISLSGKSRLIWFYERPILVTSSAHAQRIQEHFVRQMSLHTLLPGYDSASIKPAEMWTNGGEWHDVHDEPLPWDYLFGMIVTASRQMEFGNQEIPLEKLQEKMEKEFPGRWDSGPFELNNVGVRFWDESADNSTGCQIKPDGMLCFTGHVGFMKWENIFGVKWCNDQKNLNLGEAAAGVYFDGKSYWREIAGGWFQVNRQDLLLYLTSKGLSDTKPKGDTISEAGKVLNHLQEYNRVKGAAPLINYKPGVIKIDGNPILNISTVRALEPSPRRDLVPADDFPWLFDFLWNLFCERQADDPTRALDHFLAWLQRSYQSQREFRGWMGQSVFLCGPPQNGKTLLSMRIVKPLLGDKAGNPYDYFTGVTSFNSELFECPLWAINDEDAPDDRQKKKYNARMKAFTVNPSHTYHPKFCDRVPIEWTGRILTTLNDDPESVGVLPELNPNTQDKLMFFATRPREKAWDDNDTTEAKIEKELPVFASWLLNTFQPPSDVIGGGRMKVASYFDDHILDLSRQQLFAYNLLELLVMWCNDGPAWSEDNETWQGTASDTLSQLGLVPHMEPLVRTWTVARLANSLTTLARVSTSGVTVVEGTGTRQYKFNKQEILKHQ